MKNAISPVNEPAEISCSAANDIVTRRIFSPSDLKKQFNLDSELKFQIQTQRNQIKNILNGNDDRLLIVVGPCSIHDEKAAIEYGTFLADFSKTVSDKMLLVMRAYVEKPRTNIGWKGFAYDPDRDGIGNIEQGVLRSRQLMIKLAKLGLPLSTEALNPLVITYLDDLISWTAIGARTSESQIHREMVSNLNMPVGIKNNTNGSIDTAVNAMISSKHSHHTLGIDDDGHIAMINTPCNPHTHLVLRGGKNASGVSLTNFDALSISESSKSLEQSGMNTKVMIDCSHDNAQKQHHRQIEIAKNVVTQRCNGNMNVMGLMLESFLKEGNQSMNGELIYGKSITDPCISWNQTKGLLAELSQQMN
ncbi:3-deoxy-7-phosphoheptulonate synthase [Parashewanella spongiae]|uniref:Phospho-2-dehydro-3-deoxyheptonate aldolase n=1 Tax=Parashewanella spongiae TaxID=342950 RepID=A0A3A6TML4_9GAMM|nr:3-deoxy-7-phosphoheptulonate synthase [Parashewanella spongiae]MCL1079948.1 3-deoxy-7-phosphoheptulonate synthase [Parashewanella spongiae]RJY06184.1 3-deoxy-7-phosphoheptulonate synthase [Parashewanella spongiae]